MTVYLVRNDGVAENCKVRKFPNKEIISYKAKGDVTEIAWVWDGNHEDIMLLHMIADVHPGIVCTVYYLPYSRMDRQEDGFPYSLKLLVRQLPKDLKYHIIDAHSEQAAFLMWQAGLSVIESSWVTDKSRSFCDEITMQVIKVLPDKGAVKRYKEIKPDYIGIKEREFSTGNILSILAKKVNPELTIDDDRPITVRIFDDMCSKGGTFIGLKKALIDIEPNLIKAHWQLIVNYIEPIAREGEVYNEFEVISNYEQPR